MHSCQNDTAPFRPVSCADVIVAVAGNTDWLGAATWVAIVGGETPRLFASLIEQPDRPPTQAPNFSICLPGNPPQDKSVVDHTLPSSPAAVHIKCNTGAANLGHGRLVLSGNITAVHMENVDAPWLTHLLRTSDSASAYLSHR